MYSIWCLGCEKWFDLKSLTDSKVPAEYSDAIPVFMSSFEVRSAIEEAKDNEITHADKMRSIAMGESRRNPIPRKKKKARRVMANTGQPVEEGDEEW